MIKNECADSSFCDPYHKHIIKWDLRIIKNKKLRKLLRETEHYIEPWTINLSKALIVTALDTCIEAITLKTKYSTSNFKPWKEKILAKLNEQITELKPKMIQYCVTQMLKGTWKNFIEDLLLSSLIKHQTIWHLYVENTYSISKLLAEVSSS